MVTLGFVAAAAAGHADLRLAFLGTTELLLVLAIVVVLFGATKLPQLGKGLGEAIGNFKKAQREVDRGDSREEIDATPRVEAKRNDRLENDPKG